MAVAYWHDNLVLLTCGQAVSGHTVVRCNAYSQHRTCRHHWNIASAGVPGSSSAVSVSLTCLQAAQKGKLQPASHTTSHHNSRCQPPAAQEGELCYQHSLCCVCHSKIKHGSYWSGPMRPILAESQHIDPFSAAVEPFTALTLI